MDQPVTLIIGLGREVGEAVARRFFEAGHGVIAVDSNSSRVEHARGELDERILVARQEGLHQEGSVKNCLTMVRTQYERLDNLVVIPTLPEPDTLEQMDPARFGEAVANSASTAMLAMRLFANHIDADFDTAGARVNQARQRGAIVFILSLQNRLLIPGRFTQNATQGAIEAVMRAGALELAAKRIRVNAVSAIRPRAQSDDEERKWLKSRTPLGRAALADEIADTALFLSSNQSAIITGETLVLDGGRSLLSGVLGNGSASEAGE